MGLALGSSIISNNHEYGYKENVNAELALAKAYTNSCEAFSNSCSNAESNALQSMNSAKISEDNAAQSETNSKASENNAKISESNAKAYAESIDPNNLLHLNGGREIVQYGPKYYQCSSSGGVPLLIQNVDDDYSTAPTADLMYQYGMTDKNGTWLGGFEKVHYSDGRYTSIMNCRGQNSDKYGQFLIDVYPNGAVRYSPAQMINYWLAENSAYGYRIWSDGYCEQWGASEVIDDQTITISLYKTYRSDYNVVCSTRDCGYTSTLFAIPVIHSRTVSSFQVGGMTNNSSIVPFFWKSCGCLADGQW